MEGIKLKSSDFKISGEQVFVNSNVHKGKPGMLLIHADWCGHCQRFKPTFNQLCSQLGQEFGCTSIEDTDLDDDNLKMALKFQGFPTIKFFDQTGRIIGEYSKGNRSKEALLDHICDIYHHCVKFH
jgi:thiol-disulfide isomerase/thioredoxin